MCLEKRNMNFDTLFRGAIIGSMIPSFLISEWTLAVGIIYAPRVTSYTLHTITNHSDSFTVSP